MSVSSPPPEDGAAAISPSGHYIFILREQYGMSISVFLFCLVRGAHASNMFFSCLVSQLLTVALEIIFPASARAALAIR